jgi:hypothetical protein
MTTPKRTAVLGGTNRGRKSKRIAFGTAARTSAAQRQICEQ